MNQNSVGRTALTGTFFDRSPRNRFEPPRIFGTVKPSLFRLPRLSQYLKQRLIEANDSRLGLIAQYAVIGRSLANSETTTVPRNGYNRG